MKYDFIVPVNKFIKKYEILRTKILDHPEVVINVDETRVSRNATNSNIKYVVASEQKNGSFIVPNTLSTLSAVVFITASGHTLLIVHVLPDNSINEENDDIVVGNDEARSSRCMRGSIMNVAICKTKSGWVTKKAWKAMIHYFSKISKNWLNGKA